LGKVLIIEDTEDIRFSLAKLVKKEGYVPFDVATGEDALGTLASHVIDLVFLDIGLPDAHGIEVLKKIKAGFPDVDVVMLTGVDDAGTAVAALKSGALDYILKPYDNVRVRNILQRIMKSRFSLNQYLLDSERKGLEGIIGEASGMMKLKEAIRVASEVRSPVVVTGETGTGKELVARAIYDVRERKSGLFVKVDCGTLAPTIIESELFGHERGAFTDATRDKKGLAEMADGGTLFLDEIGTLPSELQPKLLRLIEESTFRRVGGLQDRHVDVRIIAATNLDLEKEMQEGAFREDLYYRLSTIELTVPPLRERGDDVLTLAHSFLRRFNHEMRKNLRGFSAEAEAALRAYSWPGNVRELKNCIERTVIYARGEWINPAELGLRRLPGREETEPQDLVPLEQMERKYIGRVLAAAKGNKTLAARILGISRTTLREKLKTGSS
jgi:two-component system response regulator HydG